MNKEHYSKQLANYCDYEMKQGLKGSNDSQIDERLSDIINLFKCLNNKMIFQYEYSKRLTDRLITGKSNFLQAEQLLINKLRAEQGITFVSKMTSMMKDLESSRSMMDYYVSLSSHRGRPCDIQFKCQVLQSGAWEIDKTKLEKFNLPKSLLFCMEDFKNFYLRRQKTHLLNWSYGHGNLEINFNYLKKPHQSLSTLLQYTTLCLLEQHDVVAKSNNNEEGRKLSVEFIAAKIGVSLNTLIFDISGLIFNPIFNPKKDPQAGVICTDIVNTDEIKADNKVWINHDFSSNYLRINTIPIMMKVRIIYSKIIIIYITY